MTMVEWAENEVNFIKEQSKDDPYTVSCLDSAYKAFQSLLEDGHSGYSIKLTRNLLMRLIDGKPLTSIEDIPEIWDKPHIRNDVKTYQCKRMFSLFKDEYPDGKVNYHDVERTVKIDAAGRAWHSNFIDDIVDEMYPITMPYSPGERIEVYSEDFLVDRKNGDWDTEAVFYLVKDGKRIEINRFFTTDENGEYKEITKEEYEKLKKRRIN